MTTDADLHKVHALANILAQRFRRFLGCHRQHRRADIVLPECVDSPLYIRVNTVNPGLIRTPDWENTARELRGDDWESYLQEVADEHADMKRFGSVEELANFCVFLCSPRASYSVGSAHHVDGGMLKTV